MNCNELVELVTAYLEGALDPGARARFEEHLHGCDGCGNYLQQFRTTVGALSAICEDTVDVAFRDRLLDAFHDWR
jgi:anti-sigma factor RsiW